VSFLETVGKASAYVRQHGRVSLRAIGLEFGLDDDALDVLAAELVEVQGLAAREGQVLTWIGPEEPEAAAADAEPPFGAAAAAPEAERRQLTVLFCDLVESTQLAAGQDPEDWCEVVRSYQQSAAEVIEGFEGHVAQYLGDGLLVYFGYPQAHEDDAERAVRTGLGIVAALSGLNDRLGAEHGLRLAVRIGIHTGRAVVGEVGGGASRETLALGDTTNLAARIQGEAEPDCVAISSDTLRLVRGIFVTEELGRRTLKGIREPLALHRVVQPSGVRSRLDVAHGHLTPFIGRDQELGLLLDRWDQVLEREGQTMLVSGEAGVGKSRLALALRERLADEPHTWLECHCSPYTQGSAFRPIIGLVEQEFAFGPEDGPERRLRRIEDGVEQSGLVPGVVPLIADLLGVPLGADVAPQELPPKLQRERTFDALVAWVLALGEMQPVLLLVEDLHWCDPSSLELLGRAIEQVPTSRVLLLLTTRPEFEVPWAHPQNWTPVALGRLRRRQARGLVVAASEARPLPEEAVSQIVERADGMALYLEELTRAALESEQAGAPLTIPATLQDSLMARLDRLSSAKEVAHQGSVIGREFPYRLLEAVTDLDPAALRQGLERLVHADVLFHRGTPPEATYTFRHALLQQTAYESLLRRRRREIHARVARTLEEHFPERAESEPEEVGRHHAEAEQWSQAVGCYARAGENATQRSAYEEAVGHLDRGIRCLERTPESADRSRRELALRISLGPPLIGVRGYGDPQVETNYTRARELSEATGDKRQLFEAVWGLANYHQAKSHLRLAKDLGRQLVELAKQVDDAQLLSWAHLQFGATRFWIGEFEASLAELERAVECYDPSEYQFLPGAPDPCVSALVYSGLNLWQLGRSSEALEASKEGTRVARRTKHAFSLGIALCFEGSLHQVLGDAAGAREAADEVIPLASEYGFPVWRGWGGVLRGWSLTHSGERARGVELLEQSLGEIAGTGSTLASPAALAILAEAQQAAGLWGAAATTAAAALAVAEQEDQHAWDAELLRLRGVALLEEKGSGDPEALACVRRALDVARGGESLAYELRASLSLSRQLWRTGERAEARALLAGAIERFPEDPDSRDLRDARALHAELS
jgi:class 3 adenylate cyclase/predicted ATPase